MGLKDWYDRWVQNISDWKPKIPSLVDLQNFVEDSNFNINGFTNKIKWNATYEDALKEAKENDRPVMMIVHAPECRSCKSFRDWFSRSSGIITTSQYFSMVAVRVDSLPRNAEITKDGNYVPQVIFLTPGGNLIPQGERQLAERGQKHFFPGTTPLLASMRSVLNLMPPKN
uniref:Thioredoxin domain-containing protein 12 n=1 Tax=Lygus hesperus TaxID=30085 RepID=A0A0A9XIA5_LYGHE